MYGTVVYELLKRSCFSNGSLFGLIFRRCGKVLLPHTRRSLCIDQHVRRLSDNTRQGTLQRAEGFAQILACSRSAAFADIGARRFLRNVSHHADHTSQDAASEIHDRHSRHHDRSIGAGGFHCLAAFLLILPVINHIRTVIVLFHLHCANALGGLISNK